MSLNRRGFLFQSLALSAAPVGAAAWAQTQAKLEDSLVIRTTGGVFEQALKRNFFDPFTKATGVKVVPVAASYGEMMAKTAAMNAAGKVEWDIISPQYYELGKLSNSSSTSATAAPCRTSAKEGVPNACGRYGVLYLIGGQVLTWSTQAFKDKRPTKWADLWDQTVVPRSAGAAEHRQPLGQSHHLAPRRRRRARKAVPSRSRSRLSRSSTRSSPMSPSGGAPATRASRSGAPATRSWA